jgi:hypothetical protein
MPSLAEKIRTAAINYSVTAGSPAVTTFPLRALLGTGSPLIFRWYDTTLKQNATYPSVVMQEISNAPTYVFVGRTATSFSRFQFTIWGGQYSPGVDAADNVSAALLTFFDQLDLVGIPGLVQYNNMVLGNRRAAYTETDQPIYQRVMDVRIFSNDMI